VIVAVFNTTTGWFGRTIAYDETQRCFALEGHGPLWAGDVVDYDQRGQIAWVQAGLRDWVYRCAESERQARPEAFVRWRVFAASLRDRPVIAALVSRLTTLANRQSNAIRWLMRLALAFSLLLLAALCVGSLLIRNAAGPYDAYRGPTPLAWWLVAVVFVIPAALVVCRLAVHPHRGLTVAILIALAVTTVCFVATFMRQSIGLLALFAATALALCAVAFVCRRDKRRGRGWTAIIVLASVVTALGVAGTGLGMLQRHIHDTTVLARSPDGRRVLVEDYAAGILTGWDEIDVRQDTRGLLRRQRTVFISENVDSIKAGWLNNSTVLINGQRVSVHASPPPGW
jgi:hypothetical protein